MVLDAEALEKRYNFLVNSVEDEQKNEAFCQLTCGLELLRDATPFRVVEMALEIQVERMRVVEATKARDATVHRLLDAYISVRRQSELIEQLQKERKDYGLEKLNENLVVPLDRSECALKDRIAELETMLEDLRDINRCLKEYGSFERKFMCDPPPHYEKEISRESTAVQTDMMFKEDVSTESLPTIFCDAHPELCKLMSPKTQDIIELIQARNDMLATIPLPANAPDMTLAPITLPPQVTLHEFLNAAPTALRNELGNYRVFHNTTTNWCPEREEHGFMYVPMFKCSTNPRAVTAHRWNVVDVIGRMNKPTECFYSNEGTWYYAGSYKAFYIDVVSTNEWEHFSSETTSALIKETLSGRKNTTPQNNYETGQLYAAGALKVVCVALQCVGFNLEVYHAVSELATRFTHTKWKSGPISANGISLSPSAGSTSSSIAGTPPISSSSNSFSGIPSPHGGFAHGLGHAAHIHGHGGTLQPHIQSKLNSPLSPHGGSGPCTPNLPNSGMSTPGVSPVGISLASGVGGGGLGNGSPAWNIASSLKLKSMNVNTTGTHGLQLSNISLSPGTAAGIMHHQQRQPRSGHAMAPMFYEGSGNNENIGPGVIGPETGLMAGMTIGGTSEG